LKPPSRGLGGGSSPGAPGQAGDGVEVGAGDRRPICVGRGRDAIGAGSQGWGAGLTRRIWAGGS